MSRSCFIFCAAALSLGPAYAVQPSKTDVIQCGIDAGSRKDDARRAFVEGCLTVKTAARQEIGAADPRKPKPIDCTGQAQAQPLAVRKSFVDGCMEAKESGRNYQNPAAAR